MAAIIQDNSAEQEYLWSCTLSGSAKEYTWNPEDPADTAEDDEKDPSVKPGHRLLIKAAVLMPSAKMDEVTIVQVESEGYKKEKVVVPICAMKGGQNLHQYVDLLLPTQAKFTLLQGEGPIHLVGSHCVDFFGYRTNSTFSSHLENCQGLGGNKEVNDGKLGDEEFSEELLLGEEFDLVENSELDLIKIKEKFASIKQETDENEIKLENVKVEMSGDPSTTQKEMTLQVSGSSTDKYNSEISKVEEKKEIVEGDIAGERVKVEQIERHELTGEYVEFDENPANEFQNNELLDEKKEKKFSSLDVKSETYMKRTAENMEVESSMESIEIVDSDEEEDIKQPIIVDKPIDLTAESVVEQPRNILVKKPIKRKKKGRAPAELKPCHYCVEEFHVKIELAKHMISDHWETVYEAHGGGRKPNSTYYQMEDSMLNQMGMLNRKSFQQMKNLAKFVNQTPSIHKNPHNPSLFRKTPTRNILPKPKPGEVFDLTADDQDEIKCKVCEDDFNWPDDKHDCRLKRNKKMKLDMTKNTDVDLEKGGLTLRKEKLLSKSVPASVKSNEKGLASKVTKKEQFEASLKKVPKSTMLVPVRNPPTGILSDKNFSAKPPPARVQPTETRPARNLADGVKVMSSMGVKTY